MKRKTARSKPAAAEARGAPRRNADKLLELPNDLLFRIWELLPQEERAKLALLNKSWRKAILSSWTSVEWDGIETAHDAVSFKRLGLLAGHNSSLHTLVLQTEEKSRSGNVEEATVIPRPWLPHLTNLRKLILWQSQKNPRGWTDCKGLVMTKQHIKDIHALQRLEELSINYRPHRLPGSFTLAEFAGFSQLQTLSILLERKYQIRGWVLNLSQKFSDLTRLVNFTIENLSEMVVTSSMKDLVGRLESLCISSGTGAREVATAESLTRLEVKKVDGAEIDLPFQTSNQLKHLSVWWEENSWPEIRLFLVSSQVPSLTSLRLSHFEPSLADLQQLSGLSSLVELYVNNLWMGEGETLEHFPILTRLERLEASLLHRKRTFQERLRPRLPLFEGHTWERLRFLRLTTSGYIISCVIHLQNLPALEEFRGINADLRGPLNSTTLRLLHLERSDSEPQNINLGRLPELCSLKIKAVFFRPEGLLTNALQQMRKLRDLSLTQVAIQLPTFDAYRESSPVQKAVQVPGFIQTIMKAVASAQTLRTLTLVSMRDSLQLTREMIPSVKHLSIACLRLEVCASCMPWKEVSVDIHFLESIDSTPMQLKACQELKVTEDSSRWPKWTYFNACKGSLMEIEGTFRIETAASIIRNARQLSSTPFEQLSRW